MNSKIYQKIWDYIRIMKYFSLFDLQILLIIDKHYLQTDDLEEYLHKLSAYKIIKSLKNDSFRLEKNLGEYAPIFVAKNTLYNPNDNKNIFLSSESNPSDSKRIF